MDAGYTRYELSNFCRKGVSSIHNRVYREMGDYLGFGPSASSFIQSKEGNKNLVSDILKTSDNTDPALRWTNTYNLTEYLKGNFVDPSKTVQMTQKDILIESFFLGLRTDIGIKNIQDFESVLVKNYRDLVEKYKDEWYFYDTDDRLLLTDQGMDVFNTVVTDLLNEI